MNHRPLRHASNTLVYVHWPLCHASNTLAIASCFKHPWHLDSLSPKELALLGHAFACVGARSEGLFDVMSEVCTAGPWQAALSL
eukprot:scaffold91810_cov21-Tisochrysis_lutea.AAC.1